MTPDDISEFATVTEPIMHPDGVRVAFTVRSMNLDEDRYESSIWLWNGSEARAFTHGPADSRPRWSPDGESLAFLRSSGEKGASAQLGLMSVAGGEASVITEFELGVSEAEWSPDGECLAVIATEWTSDWRGLDDDARARSPRRVLEPGWRFENRGYLHDKQSHVHLVRIDGTTPVALTDGDRSDSDLVWRPDGQAVGFISARHERAAFTIENQAWEIPTSGGDPTALCPIGVWSGLSFRPDGTVYLVGLADATDQPASSRLYRVEDGGPVLLGADLDRSVSWSSSGLQWLESGSCVVMVEDTGSVVVVEIAADGSWREIAGGRRCVVDVASRPDGSAMVFATTGIVDPGELTWFEADEETVMTDINETFRNEAKLIEPEHFVVESDGVELDVWVFLPPGDDDVPVLFNIHGGPATQYGWTFHDEFQVYVGAGYGVVATNPRGASGKGDGFMRGALGRWNESHPPDIVDLLTALDTAVQRVDRLDPERMGIMGGSYGGLISAKILAVDHRFKCAVPERGLYNFASFSGTSDIGLWFGDAYVGERDYSNWAMLWDASPLRTAHLIDTPCLVIHSENDYRCPIEQGEQFFSLLIDNGVEAEFLRFPNEGHELSRSGAPEHRRERFVAILEWHDRYLRPDSQIEGAGAGASA